MKTFLKSVGILIVIIVVGGFGTFKYMNRTPPQLKEPNYFAYYKSQDSVPEGKVGIFI